MKKFIVKILIFFAIVAIIDFCFGLIFDALPQYAKGGDTHRAITISDRLTDDVLILGSSRAVCHYDPQILEDSIGMTVYNCGLEGNGIFYNYGIFKLIEDRYLPKIVIYEVTPGFDLIEDASLPNQRYLGALRMFYDRDGISEIFQDIDSSERLKMLSHMYRHNKRFIQFISDIFMPQQTSIKGYKPIKKGMMDYELKKEGTKANIHHYDTLKLKYLEKLASDCQKDNINLIFAISPEYGVQESIDLSFIEDLCSKYGCVFWIYQNDPDICLDNNLFKDSFHMNQVGATDYSKKIAHRLKDYIIENFCNK